MHDHNLDDLIIDNIEPKNSKLKSFLTIIALLIVILIVAIVLTRILLKSPENNDLMFAQESAELIAPELKLQETPKPEEAKKELILSNMVESKPEPTVVVKKEEPKPVVKPPVEPKVVETKKEPVLSNITRQEVKAPVAAKEISSAEQEAKDAADRAYWESVQAKRKAEQEAREKAEAKAKEALKVVKPVEPKKVEIPVIEKPKPVAKPIQKVVVKKPVAPKPAPKSTSTRKYYVQVGAFRGKPSTRFLSVIRNNGYRYIMTKPNSSGMKRLLVGPFKDKASVDRALIRIKDRIHKRAFIVKR
jgi:DedD protein